MVVIKNEDNLIFFSVAYIPYDIKDIKLVSKPLVPPTYRHYLLVRNSCDIDDTIALFEVVWRSQTA